MQKLNTTVKMIMESLDRTYSPSYMNQRALGIILWKVYTKSEVVMLRLSDGSDEFHLFEREYNLNLLRIEGILKKSNKHLKLNELEKQYVARVKEMKRRITGEAVPEEEAYNPFGKVEKWEVISQSNRLYYKLDRHGGYKDFWKTFSDLLEHCSRDNLKEIFEHGMAVFGEVLNEEEVEDAIVDKIKKALEWLCMLFDVNRVQDLVVQEVEIVNQWVLYESCGVYAVVCDGSNCEYYLVEGDYNHSLVKLQKMIEKGLSCSISSEMGADLQVGETTAKSLTLLLITQSTTEEDKLILSLKILNPCIREVVHVWRKKDGDKFLHSILHGPHPIPVTTVDGREVPKDFTEMDVAERERYMIDVEAQNYLIQAIPNEIFRKLDSYDESAKSIWDQLQKIMMGSKVGNQMRITNLMDRYENFRMKEDESLEETYDGFVELMNDMKKNNIIRSEMDYIVKFINNLSSDWKQFSRFVKQHKVLNELKVYEVYENLLLFEEEVNEIVAERKKKEKTEADTLALLAEKEKAKKKVRKGKVKVFEAFEDEEEEDEEEYDEDEKDQMLQSLLSLTEAYKKKYHSKSGSNNRRFSTRGGRGFNRNYMQSSQGYPPRVENQFVDKYATKKEEIVKDTPERTEEKKGQAAIICYKCGKTGHIAKGCLIKMTKVEMLRKKLELAEKQEQGLVLMADDEEWLDYSDNDDQAQMCFMGLMEEESESDEDIESDGETSTIRSFSLDDHKRKMLE
ncbi:hypothetical protein OSB04_017194, partial [Centaurea solstitialis]